MEALRLQGVAKVFAGGQTVIENLDLAVEDGELVVLLGPSGCGKSTLLRMVAGIESLTRGRIHIGGRDVTNLAPQDRDVAMVFQNYALYPHMTVRENLGFGLKMRGASRPEIEARVTEVANKLDLGALLERRPAQLSGGQRQRVALGRALARRARLFLMDEPLSNLDVKLRVATRTEIARLQRELGIPTLYVTHDQEEAMTLGHRVVVMEGGRIQQISAPRDIYLRPASVFVAGFVGSPAMNFLHGEITRVTPQGRPELRLAETGARIPLQLGGDAGKATTVIVGIRPEDLEVVNGDGASRGHTRGIGAGHLGDGEGGRRGGAGELVEDQGDRGGVGGESSGVIGDRGSVPANQRDADADLVMDVEHAEPLGREWLIHGRVRGTNGGSGVVLRVLTNLERDWSAVSRLPLRLRRDRIHLFDSSTERRLDAAG